MIGMGLLVVIAFLVYKSITVLSITLILLLAVVIYIILNIILYLYLSNKGVKEFKTLSV